jgi:hypothetical protein
MKIKSFLKSFLIVLFAPVISLLLPVIVKADEDLGGPITDADFEALNPLVQANDGAGGDKSLMTPGGIISKLLEFAFPLAGIILFVMLIWGGFEMLYGASTSKAMEAGKNRITSAIIGFFLLFASFWIIQIIEVVFGITIFV